MKVYRNEESSSAVDGRSQMIADRTYVLSIVCFSLFIIKLASPIGVAANPRVSLDLESLSGEGQAEVVWTAGTAEIGADVDFSLQWSTNLVDWTNLTELVHRPEVALQRESVQIPQTSGGFLRIARTDAMPPPIGHVLYASASLAWPTPTDRITRFSRDEENWTREAHLSDFINHPPPLEAERNLGGIAIGQDGSIYWLEIEGDFDVAEPYQAYVYRKSSQEQVIEQIGVVFEDFQAGFPSPFAFDVEVSEAGVVYASAQVENFATDTWVETIARFEKVESTWQRSVVLSDFIDATPESDRVLGGFAVDESESLYWIVISGTEQIDDLFQGHVYRRDGGTHVIEEIGSIFEAPFEGTPSPYGFDIELTENTVVYAAGQIELFDGDGDETVEVVARFEKDGDAWQRTVALQDFVDPHPELLSAFRLGGIAVGDDGAIYWVVVEGNDQFGTPFQGHVHCQVPGAPHSQMIGSVFDEPIDGFPGDHAFDVELR